MSKAELGQFAHENKIRFREDATNFSLDAKRNRIRNELLPLLRNNYQPGLNKTVLRLMEIVGAEADFTGDFAHEWERRHPDGRARREKRKRPGRRPAFPTAGFDKLPLAIQRRILQSRLAELGVAADFELIESLLRSANCFVSVGPEISVSRDAGGKVLLRLGRISKFNESKLVVKLGRAGEAVFGGGKSRWKLTAMTAGLGCRRAGSRGRSPHQMECFDADKIGGEIILRHWQPGDRFQPIGLSSSAKLQDLFVNAKIPAARRRKLVLAATAAGEIFWVEGLRIGELFKLTASTRRRLVWNWQSA